MTTSNLIIALTRYIKGTCKKMRLQYLLYLIFLMVEMGAAGSPLAAQTPRSAPPKLPLHDPRQITSEADSVRYATISADGRWLVYSAQHKGFTDLWRRSVDPTKVVLPEQLTADPANETAPALSPNGRYLAYTGTAHDVKGDIYLIDLESPQHSKHRLTGRNTADGFATFSADGQTLYWHQGQTGRSQRRIISLNLTHLQSHLKQVVSPSNIQYLKTKGDAAFPASSPTDPIIAFVSVRNDSGGDIYSLNMKNGRLKQWTTGPALDLFPTWSPDGRYIYFSRIALDTNHDGQLTLKDRAVIHRLDTLATDCGPVKKDGVTHCPKAYPLTTAAYEAIQPHVTDSRLYFLSTRKGVSNLWSLPPDGEIPSMDDAKKQFNLAREVAEQIPADTARSILAHYRVLENHDDHQHLTAQAAYHIGRLYADLELPKAAIDSFQNCAATYVNTQPWAAFSQIEAHLISTRTQWTSAETKKTKQTILDEGVKALGHLAANHAQPAIKTTAALRQAQLILELGPTSKSWLTAAQQFTQIVQNASALPQIAAEAAFYRAQAYRRIGLSESIRPAYLMVIDTYPDAEPWADQAVTRLLDLSIDADTSSVSRKHVEKLEQIATVNRKQRPRLAMGALNRMGDLFFARNELAPAKSAYRRVLDQYPETTSQTAAARLALAEIFYREERFRKALDLYEREIDRRPYADRIYRLSREGYIRKSIASGAFLYRVGEVAAARNVFKTLLDYDDNIIEAHRGYIQCAAAQQEIRQVIQTYQQRLESNDQDHIALYAKGLALTYLEDKISLKQAQRLISQAITYQGQIEYYHQTLGYILEVLESVHQEKGKAMLSLEAYRKAYFLNNPQRNSANAANLLLNQGNGYFRLGQYHRALDFYQQRSASKAPFENSDTEILFYRRLGAAAFQVKDHSQAVKGFQQALTLVESNIKPRQASTAFDDISRFIMDRILTPGIQILERQQKNKHAKDGKTLAQKQSEINRQRFQLTQASVALPPNPAWKRYQKTLTALLAEQSILNRACLAWIDSSPQLIKDLRLPGQATGQSPETVARSTLAFKKNRVEKAMEAPIRFTQLKVELLDRLGLAYQEGSQWQKAKETFQRVFELNERLALTHNLARSKRSVAYNTYLQAGQHSGQTRQTMLHEAASGFAQVITLVRQYGVTPPKSKPKPKSKALLDLQLTVAQDKQRTTAALFGFSVVQEKRMAEAFISRIKTELGEISPAYQAITQQIAAYPPESQVAEKDLYGVSLLNHRAGHLAAPLGQPKAAFDYFERSAQMALEMGQAVSSGLNVMNMAHLLTHNSRPDFPSTENYRRLEALNQQVSRLLAMRAALKSSSFNAIYHNTMGVYELHALGADNSNSNTRVQTAVHRITRLQQAADHFTAGLATYTSEKSSTATVNNREDLYRFTALHLNMAQVAESLGEPQRAQTHLQMVLEKSEQGRFPDLRWRALARMGQLSQALEVLESVTLLRAFAQPGEIMAAFTPLVLAHVQAEEFEEGFNLTEHLAELERVHRLAPLFTTKMAAHEKKWYRRVHRHLKQMETLRLKLGNAKADERVYLKEALERESGLLASQLGPQRKHLPGLVSLGENKTQQDQLMLLAGLALEAEAVADKIAFQIKPNPALQGSYETLLEEYHHLMKKVLQNQTDANTADGLITVFSPNPAEAIDLMEGLPQDGMLTRLLTLNGPTPKYIAFSVTADDIRANVVTAKEVIEFFQKPAQTHFVSHDNPAALPRDFFSAGHNISYTLSATHLHRCLRNRKPFKRTLLALPSESIKPAKGYEMLRAQHTRSAEQFLATIPQAHTLLISGRSGIFHTVPTRAGENAQPLPAIETAPGRMLPLNQLTGRLTNTTLALLQGASIEQAYTMGHLFALLGCPTLVLPMEPSQDDMFTRRFLEYYATSSATTALKKALTAAVQPNGWIQMGDPGMTPTEATHFARERFVDYVKKGQAAFKAHKFEQALAYFENAILIAKETAPFKQHLPDLYRFSRESAYKAKDNVKALSAAKALVQLMNTTAPDSEHHAEALLRLGLLQAHQEQYGQALPNLEESLEIITNLEDPLQEMTTLSAMGVVLENAVEYDQALDKFMSAARLGRTLDKKELIARQYVNLGRLNDLRLSRYAQAKADYTRALTLYRELGQRKQQAQMLLNVGRCERLLGNFQTADKQYRTAWQHMVNDKSEDPILKAKILIEQANNAWFQARYQEAFSLQRQSLMLAQKNDWPLGQVIALNTSGLIWWTLADHPRALRELTEALTLAEKLKTRSDEVASTLNNLGLIYRATKQYPEALAAFERALAIDRKLKSRWAISYDLRNLGLTYYHMGNYEKALPLFETAAKEAGAIGNRINQAKALLGLGQTRSALKQDSQAIEPLEQALELARRMVLRETQWRALHELAKIKLRGKARKEAHDLLLQAVETIESMRAELKIDQLKEGFIENKTAVYETLVTLLAEQGNTTQAFDIAERSRARNFIDLLGNQRINLHGTAAQAQYDRLLFIKARINEQEALLAQTIETETRAVYQNALKRLKDNQQDLMLEIQIKNPQLSSLVTVNPLKVSQIQALLEPGVVLLAYYTVPKEIFCWLVSKNDVTLFRTPLSRDTLVTSVNEYRRMTQNLEPLEQQSRELFQWLLAPVIAQLKNNRYVGIIPHGVLHYLSFATLSNGNRYMIDDYPLFYLPSASVYDHTLKRRRSAKNTRVLAIGNPTLDNPSLELPFAEREVESIKWNFSDITILTRQHATESWVQKHITEFGIIHLASHGKFDPVNPLFSAIQLRKDATADGDLEAAEVFGMDLNADLVVLSACQTGIGRVKSGDEVVGLNRAYFYAGTHAIISSLWRVSDISTAVLMKQFYRRYKDSNKSDGLRQATLHVKSRYSHPGYWGAFTLVGDYQ